MQELASLAESDRKIALDRYRIQAIGTVLKSFTTRAPDACWATISLDVMPERSLTRRGFRLSKRFVASMRMRPVQSETADRAAALLGRLASPGVGMPARRDRLIGSLATASSSRQVEQVVDRPLIVRVLAVMRRLNRPIGKYQEVRWKTSYATIGAVKRSEEHTSELQSRQYLVCRLLL